MTKGVRQGACSSPILFNIVMEQLSRKLAGSYAGLQLSTSVVNSLLYADDVILLGELREQLQELCKLTDEWARECHLTINTAKTDYVIFGFASCSGITIGGETLPPKPSMTYLGYHRSAKGNLSHIEHRIAQAKKAALRVGSLLRTLKHLPVKQQVHMAEA